MNEIKLWTAPNSRLYNQRYGKPCENTVMAKAAKAERFNVGALGNGKIQDRLQRLSELKDRNPPPAFVGRTELINKVQRTMDDVASSDSPPIGATQAVQGIPGVGKTTAKSWIAASLSGREVRGADGVSRLVLAVPVMPSAISKHPNTLCRGITKSMRMELAESERAQSALRRRVNDAGAMAILTKTMNGEYDIGEKVHGVTLDSTHDECFGVYATNGLWPKRVAILLLVDEAQKMDDTPQARACLNFLHEQSNKDIRILPVFFGLPDTRQRLTELGLSRLDGDAVTNVGLLEKGEGAAMIDATLDLVGLKWGNEEWRGILQNGGFTAETWAQCRDGLVQQVVDDSCDFPQHLIRGLKAIGSALGEHVSDLKPSDWAAVKGKTKTRHRAGRASYYDERLDNVGVIEHLAALGALAHKLGMDGSMPVREAGDVLNVGCEGEMTKQQSISAVNVLLAKGILSRQGKNRVGCSLIPSMVAYLKETFLEMVAVGDDPTVCALAEKYDIVHPPPNSLAPHP